MSDKEKVIQMLDNLPEYQFRYVLAFIQSINAFEKEDDDFCEAMYQRYLNDDDPEKDTVYSLEECEKEWGLS